MEFLQASVLYASFSDIAASQAVQSPDGLAQIEKTYLESFDSRETYDEAWQYLIKYRHIFEKTALQSVLVSLNSHWDWYIRKLGEFIIFARAQTTLSLLSSSQEKRIRRVGMLPIIEQLEVLESLLNIPLFLSEMDRAELVEMSLVRNLGLHNRWEIDDKYLSQTIREGYQIGDLRLINQSELYLWHGLLIKLINTSTSGVARAYVGAPTYPVAI